MSNREGFPGGEENNLDFEAPQDLNPEGQDGQLEDTGGQEPLGQGDGQGYGQAPEADGQTQGVGRGENRWQSLRNENLRYRDELAAVRAEVARMQADMQQRQQQAQYDPAAIQAQINQIEDPYQREIAQLRFSQQQHEMQVRNMQLQMANAQDQANFNGLVSQEPVYRKYGQQVEQMFAAQIQQFGSIQFSRQQILAFLVGQERLSAQSKGKERQAAQSRVQSQRVPSGGNRGNVSTGGGGRETAAQAARRRLETGGPGGRPMSD